MNMLLISLAKAANFIRSYLKQTPRVIVILVALLSVSFAYWAFSAASVHHSATNAFSPALPAIAPFWSDGDLSVFPDPDSQGPVYPYSVIPGGVSTANRLLSALGRDRVAAAHYKDFQSRSARVIRLANERQVYVSYRVGDHIFWTKKKVTLHAGETVLTDGAHLARTRCGNRISEVPVQPTGLSEPATQVLNTPVVPHPPSMSTESMPTAPLWSESSTPLLLALGDTPQTNGPGSGAPFLPPGTVGACCGSSPGSPASVVPPTSPLPQPGAGHSPTTTPLPQPGSGPATPPISTSEPRSIVLLLAGLAGMVFLLKFRRA